MSKKQIICIFPGQGTQEEGMGRRWSSESPVFKNTFDMLLKTFEEHYGVSLRHIIMEHPSELSKTAWSQPAIYCYQVAAYHMLKTEFDVIAVAGHSIGEFAALVAAGGMDPQEGLICVSERGKLMEGLAPGKMIAVLSTADQITALLERHPHWACWISAENDEKVTIVSGEPNDIQLFIAALNYAGIRHLPVPVHGAFHTPMMEPIAAPWEMIVKKMPVLPMKRPFYSSVDGKIYEQLPENYWLTHLFARVRFHHVLNQLYHDFPQACGIEMGPGNRFHSYLKRRWESTVSLGPEAEVLQVKLRLQEIGLD